MAVVVLRLAAVTAPSDREVLLRDGLKRGAATFLALALLPIAISAGIAVAGFLNGGTTRLPTAFSLCVAGLALLYFANNFWQVSRAKTIATCFEVTDNEITQCLLYDCSSKRGYRIRWKSVRSLTEVPDLITINARDGAAMMLNNDCFESAEQREAFLVLAKSKVDSTKLVSG